MNPSKKGRVRGRVLPATLRHPQIAPAGWTLRDEAEVHSDDSTQPPDDPFSVQQPPCTPAEVNITAEEIGGSKCVRGVAKGTEFERLRKYGKIPLEIKDGKIGPSCNNRTVYTTRVTWVVKHYAEMRHVSWSVVDGKEKEELIERVRADFVLDWTKKNHHRTVTSQLSRTYNAFHYKLHRKYLTYATHEEALAFGGTLVERPVWEWLCHRWASDEFKNAMVQMMNGKDPDDRTDEAAADIFREVLGHRSGYSRGMGHSVTPETPKLPGVPNEEYERLAEKNAENKKNAEYYQNRLQVMEGGLMAMRDHMQEYEERVNFRMSEMETELESQKETQTIP